VTSEAAKVAQAGVTERPRSAANERFLVPNRFSISGVQVQKSIRRPCARSRRESHREPAFEADRARYSESPELRGQEAVP
jgi:hypothetical protein